MIDDRRRSADPASTHLDIDGGTADVEDLLAPSVPEIDLGDPHPSRAPTWPAGPAESAPIPDAAAPAADQPARPVTDQFPVATPPIADDAPQVAGDLPADGSDTVAALRPATPETIRAALTKACHGSHRPLLKLLGLAGIGIAGYHGPKSDDYPLRVWRPALAVATHRPQEPDPPRAAENCLAQLFPDGDADLLLFGLGDTDGVPLTVAHRRAGSTTVAMTAVAADPTPSEIQLLTALQAPDHPHADQALGDAWWAALSAHTADPARLGAQPRGAAPGLPRPALADADAALIPSVSEMEVVLGLVDRLVAIAQENGRLRAELEALRGHTGCDT